jgi:hypothetical protein
MSFINLLGDTRDRSDSAIAQRRVDGHYLLLKYGQNQDVDGATDIAPGLAGDYAGFPLGAPDTFTTVSTSVDDAVGGTGARTWRWYYLDGDYNMFDANDEPLYFDVELNGTTPVVSIVTGIRIYRGLALTTGSGRKTVGMIQVSHTATPAVVFANTIEGFGQTSLSNCTVPAGHTGYLHRYSAELLDAQANRALLALKIILPNGTQRIVRTFPVTTTSFLPPKTPKGGLRLDEKTDIIFRCESLSSANGNVTVDYDIEFVRNT